MPGHLCPIPVNLPIKEYHSRQEVLSHYGVPKEILTDQGANFTSPLRYMLYMMFGMNTITLLSPRLMVWLNASTRHYRKCLRFCHKNGDNGTRCYPWCYLPAEIPQETTDFSPFELLYSHDVQGLLNVHVLQESWLPGMEKMNDVAEYVLRVQLEEWNMRQRWGKHFVSIC